MNSFLIREFRSRIEPWELYKVIYASSQISFFLDSIFYRPPAQLFSYIVFDPYLEISLNEKRLKLEGEVEASYSSHKTFQVLRALLDKYARAPQKKYPFWTGGALGFWAYESVSLMEPVCFRKKPALDAPKMYFGFFRDLLVYDHKRKSYYSIAGLEHGKRRALKKTAEFKSLFKTSKGFRPEETGTPSSRERALVLRNKSSAAGPRKSCPAVVEITEFRPGMPRKKFEQIVRRAKTYIKNGDIYQANLSQRFSFNFKGSALTLYEALRGINPSPFASFVKIRDLHIVSSSPERLVSKKGRFCETQPIAGTRGLRREKLYFHPHPTLPPLSEREGRNAALKACGPQGRVTRIKRELLSNEKERAEHLMLVDLERNDLGRVCQFRTVRVRELMKIERYSHVIHLVSRITGTLAPGRDSLDLLKAMFPGGTITGCPKIRCMQIIDELEPVQRGLYTGSIGYLGFDGNMDMNIIIRTLVLQNQKGWFQVGAGIVYDSDPSREYEETLHKGEALAEALVKASLKDVR